MSSARFLAVTLTANLLGFAGGLVADWRARGALLVLGLLLGVWAYRELVGAARRAAAPGGGALKEPRR
ncbi:hypothetical protein [Streptomyces abikoensis]|uniref:Uncharacterized protein n=1 Tax=Streptomyces abikoensis TaxID=97398 RepID=A0ABW7TDG1_9ACTN